MEILCASIILNETNSDLTGGFAALYPLHANQAATIPISTPANMGKG